MKIQIIRSDGTVENFKPQKIKDSLLEETNIPKAEIEKVKDRIAKQIRKMEKDEIFSSEIRELIKVSLMKYREFKSAKEYDIISVPKDTIEGFLTSRNNINANASFNSEAIGKSISDEVITEYTLRHILNKNERDAHTHAFIHIHDLSAFPTRLNCMSHDPRMFFEKGFYIEGDNGSSPYAKQPKTLTAVINWLREIMAVSGQEAFAGAQGISLFNVWLAPFIKGMEYKDIYQSLQSFIFDMNFSLTRGGEALFSNLNIELCGIPKFMANKNAIGPGGLSVGVYGDYIKEAQLIADIMIELLYNGDGNGRFFIFPNTAFVMRDEAKNNEEYKRLYEKACNLQAKFPVFYFINADIENEGGHSVVWGPVAGSTELTLKHPDGHIEITTFKEFAKKHCNNKLGKFQINEDIKTLTLDEDNKTVIWSNIKNVFVNPKEKLNKYIISGNKELICTPDHQIFTSSFNKIKIDEAEKNLITVSSFNHTNKINPDKLGILIGMSLGDATPLNESSITYNFYKKDKSKYVKNILSELKINFDDNYYFHKRDKTYQNVIQVSNPILSRNTSSVNWNDINDNIDFLAGIFSGLMSSDGYIRFNKGGIGKESLSAEFVTTNLEIVKLFKYCCFMLGLKYSSRWINLEEENRLPFCRVYISCNNHSVNILKQCILRDNQQDIVNAAKNNYRNTSNLSSMIIKEKIENYDHDFTYCLEVNGRMIVGHDRILVSNCRSNLSSNWTNDPEIDTLRTGNSSFITLNLPRYSHLAEDENDIYNFIDKYMDLGMNIMLKRDEIFKQNWDNGMYKFISQLDSNNEPYYKLENATHAWGYLGCEEMLKNLGIVDGMLDNEGQKIIHNILNHLNIRKKELTDNTGLRTSIISSPAEYCTKRLADIDYNEFGNDINVAGDKNGRYYTNSYHILGQDIDLLDKTKIESQYHAYNGGGAIIHTWLAQFPNHKSLMDLFNLQKKFNCRYMTTTNNYTHCNSCQSASNGLLIKCPNCGSSNLDCYNKITGYIAKINSWNSGKLSELKDRKEYKISG